MAQQAEAVGFDSPWLIDHLLYQFPFDDDTQPPHGLWECWSLLAALAATERVELGTLVACINFRNPALLAKTADTLDEISGGRLILGLGAGYHDFEFRAFGYPSDYLMSRFKEALAIIMPLLREGQVDFAGAPIAPWVVGLRTRLTPAATGSTEELADLLRQLAADGIAHVQLWLEPNTVAGVEAFALVLEMLDRG